MNKGFPIGIVVMSVIVLGISFVLLGLNNVNWDSEDLVIGDSVSVMQAQEGNISPEVIEEEEPEIIEIHYPKEEIQDDGENKRAGMLPITGSSSSGSSSGSSSSSYGNDEESSTQKVFENDYGRIEFSEAVDFSELEMKISHNFISVESDSLDLNIPATLTLNIDYSHPPLILRNNEICNDCSLIDNSGGKVVFEVPHFTNYSTTGQINPANGTLFARFRFYGANKTHYDLLRQPRFLDSHTGPNTTCQGDDCWRRWLEKGIFDFNITNGTGIVGTMELDGIFFATTKEDQETFNGITMMWGNATLSSSDPSFPYDGSHQIVLEYWNPSYTAFAILNGTERNITQFKVDMTNVMQNEIIITNRTRNLSLASVERGTHHDTTINNWGPLIIDAEYETLKLNLTRYPELKNHSVFMGEFNTSNATHNWIIDGWSKRWYNNTESKYHQVIYGYVDALYLVNSSACLTDDDCGNQSTCLNKGTAEAYCTANTTLINGTIYDEIGNAVSSVNISFYEVTEYDVTLNKTDTDALEPKPTPDTTIDSNGYYEAYLPENTIWHIVLQGSKKKDFNIFTNRTNNGRGHNSDVFKNDSYDSDNDFNVQGHILHNGKYEHGNFYTCNQYVEFTMFGINVGTTDVNITFAVENHTLTGVPTDNRHVCDNVSGIINEDGIVYCSDVNNPNETLFLPADGQKYDKEFTFRVPCEWDDGRYDIHVYDNIRWGKMHMIGTFFINDSGNTPSLQTILDISSENITMYSNETIDLWYKSVDEENTVKDKEGYFYLMWEQDFVYCNINVTMDQDIEVDTSGDGITDNDVDYSNCGGTNQHMWNVTYDKEPFNSSNDSMQRIYDVAKEHKAKLTATDLRGNTNETYANISVFVTEEEAYDIAWVLGQDKSVYFWQEDYYQDINEPGCDAFSLYVDGFDDGTIRAGYEYISPLDDFEPPLTDSQASCLDANINKDCGSMSRPRIKPVYSSTASVFEGEISDFLYKLKDVCGFT